MRSLWLGAPALAFAFFSSSAFADKEEAKVGAVNRSAAVVAFPQNIYSAVELRHHLNTYYDIQGYRARQEPSLHARAKLGATMQEGAIDAYATVGIIKGTQTQQLVQRRPEIEIDVYPLFGTYGQIIQYNIMQLPFAHEDETTESDSDNSTDQQGTIYTLGLAPTLVLPYEINGSSLKMKAGFDFWTELFSRKQKRDDEDRDHFALDDDEQDDESQSDTGEDSALRLFSQYMVGMVISPAWSRATELEASIYYDSDFIPEYSDAEAGSDDEAEQRDYRYKADRDSHYRIRLQYELSERLAFINDFYHFHEGFFAKKVYDDDRRYRNIARLSYKL